MQPPLTPDQLSSYIAVNSDSTISGFSGKTDLGQGLEVALAQMVAQELDVPFKAVKVLIGDTSTSVNQGGASSASGISDDCGQIINPDGLRRVIEASTVQGISRTLWEEVKFNDKKLTGVDWLSYPILDIAEAPEAIDLVLIDHPEIAPSGAVRRRRASDPSGRCRDCQCGVRRPGVRIRHVPFVPDYVKAALS